MSNSRPNNPLKSMSVGDVVSAGIRLYRSHFKSYFQISLIACLWSFIPIYGWAKIAEMSGRISRLAFAELTHQPESPEAAAQQTDPKKWQFLLASVLVALMFFGVFLGFAILIGIVVGVLAATVPPAAIALGIMGFIALIIIVIRLSCRVFVYDVTMAVEDNVDASSSISRSMSLTQGAVGRIQWSVIIAFAIVSIVTIPLQGLRIFLQLGLGDVDPSLTPILSLLALVFSFLANAVIIPFWQVIKAVLYYDLRTRREGFGLKLRP